MRKFLKVISAGVLLLTPAVSAAPENRPARQCIQLQVPIQISANNTLYDVQRIDSNIDAVDWVWDTYTWSHPNTTARVKGVIPVQESFTIDAQLCVPKNGKKADILQIATHGAGFDKRYWDVEVQPELYSYVNAALAQGYSILTYDRIGTGKSSKPNAYTVVQSSAEAEVLKELTKLARSGKLIESSTVKSSHPNQQAYQPKKIVHIGHSLGSGTTVGLLISAGELSDGAILTGFLLGNKVGVTAGPAIPFEYAAQNDRRRFGDRTSGYVVPATESSMQQTFLKKGNFDPKLLTYAESIKETMTVGEILSLPAFLGVPAPTFSGPVQMFAGEYDQPSCGGDCKNTYDIKFLESLFPAAQNVSVYLQPGTGHGLTLSQNATAGYQAMFSYLQSFGL